MMRIVLGEVQVLDESGQLVAILTPHGAGKLADKLSEAGFKLVRTFGKEQPDGQVDGAEIRRD